MAFEKIFLQNNAGLAFVEALNPHLQAIGRDMINQAKEDRAFARRLQLLNMKKQLTPLDKLRMQADAARYDKIIQDAADRGDDTDDAFELTKLRVGLAKSAGTKATKADLDRWYKNRAGELDEAFKRGDYNLPKNREEALNRLAAAYKNQLESIDGDISLNKTNTLNSELRLKAMNTKKRSLANKTMARWQGISGEDAIATYSRSIDILDLDDEIVQKHNNTFKNVIASQKPRERDLHIAIAAMRNGVADARLMSRAMNKRISSPDALSKALQVMAIVDSPGFENKTSAEQAEILAELGVKEFKVNPAAVDFFSDMLDAETDDVDPELTSRKLRLDSAEVEKTIRDARAQLSALAGGPPPKVERSTSGQVITESQKAALSFTTKAANIIFDNQIALIKGGNPTGAAGAILDLVAMQKSLDSERNPLAFNLVSKHIKDLEEQAIINRERLPGGSELGKAQPKTKAELFEQRSKLIDRRLAPARARTREKTQALLLTETRKNFNQLAGRLGLDKVGPEVNIAEVKVDRSVEGRVTVTAFDSDGKVIGDPILIDSKEKLLLTNIDLASVDALNEIFKEDIAQAKSIREKLKKIKLAPLELSKP